MISSILTLAVVAGGALSVSAQSSGLSSSCQSALAGIAASSEGNCINAAGLIPLGLAGSDSSLVNPINSWLSGACSQAACSNDTLATFATNITQGCASDLSSFGISDTSSIVSAVQQFYPTVREIACLKDNDASQLCVTQTLSNVQSAAGTLSLNNIISLVPKILSGGLAALNLPQNATCTNCLKEAYNIAVQDQPGLIPSSANSTVSGQCGASFTDGQQPNNIVETASGTALAKNSSSGALPEAAHPALAFLMFIAGAAVLQ
ncbi:hypothetical protein DENSPDRAFT_881574 [Dentipellis sp. KUC8613]|nr:hypothetical protein DENSPDRAFT_881574 [Dentipellis sp. KUC8613]